MKNRKCQWPSRDTLIKDISELGMLPTGKKYGVSNATIAYWADQYQIDWRKLIHPNGFCVGKRGRNANHSVDIRVPDLSV